MLLPASLLSKEQE
jgi:hypothetical protein